MNRYFSLFFGPTREDLGRPDQILRILGYVLIVLVVLAFLGYLWVYGYYAYRLLLFPFDYDQGEGFELLDTLMLSRGEWPYRDSNVYPFYSSNYPPVFHLAIVPLVWIFGPQYWTGRLVATIGTMVTAAALSYGVYREQKERRWWLVLFAALAFFASNYVYHVGPLFRQHMFMVMFETLAVVLITVMVDREEASGKTNNRHLFWVMVLLLLAGYTKQLAYATVAAVFIFLFLRQVKRSIIWAIPFAAVTGLIFLGLNVATDGQWYITTVSANINEFIPGQAIGLFRQWFDLHLVLIVVSTAYAFYQLYFERLSAYSIWFVIAAVNSVTAGKWGAGESYFATAVAASCLLTPLAFSRLLDWLNSRDFSWEKTLRTRLSTVAVVVMAPLLLHQAERVFHMPTHTPFLQSIARSLGKPTETFVAPQTSCSAPQPPEPIPYVDDAFVLVGRPPTDADIAAGKQISAAILEGDTAAFSEEAGFNLYVGRDVVSNPTQLLNLYKAGEFDVTNMVQMLDEQAFDTIILRAQFYPGPVLDVIGQKYQTVELIEMNKFVYCIMTPIK